jgi:hypothetical protein
MSHPLLTKWLTDNLFGLDEYTTRVEVAAQMIADSPDIADRLERALDRCQYKYGRWPCGDEKALHEPPYEHSHPYQPLVTP